MKLLDQNKSLLIENDIISFNEKNLRYQFWLDPYFFTFIINADSLMRFFSNVYNSEIKTRIASIPFSIRVYFSTCYKCATLFKMCNKAKMWPFCFDPLQFQCKCNWLNSNRVYGNLVISLLYNSVLQPSENPCNTCKLKHQFKKCF